jgi:hypothetical protein
MSRILFLAALLLALRAPLRTLVAAEPTADLAPLSISQRTAPMDTEGLDFGLAHILQSYYKRSFSGAKNWEQVQSLRFDGTLYLPQGSVRFTAFKKKPDLFKLIIFAANGGRIVMSYDGQDAWQLNTLKPDAQPVDMPEAEALNFIRDAFTGGHLLYPLQPGKEIELLGVTIFNDERYYELGITLPSGERIRSFLDMTSFAEVRQITLNHVTGDEEVNTYSDFRQIDGVRVPFTTTLTVNGQQMHQSKIERVQVDLGLTAWMFSRPSLDTASETTESPVAIPSAPPSAHNTNADPLLPVQPGSLFQIEQPKSFFEVNPLAE